MALSLLSPAAFALLGALLLGCSDSSDSGPTPTPPTTDVPATETPRPSPTASPTPPPTATPIPELNAGDAIVVGGVVRTRIEPATTSEHVGSIEDLARVTVVERVQGENWLLGTQNWLSATPPWASEWFRLEDGSFVYGSFVFVLAEGEVSPLAPVPDGVEKWIDVDISDQEARAMVGDEVRYVAAVSSGASPFPTPQGSFAVEPDGRLAVERMTASQAGYQPGQATYDVERVLFTQYFDRMGNALHLNYWRPHSVFGNTPTSHGCIGLELHEAQYLWLFAGPGTRVEIHE